MKIRINPRPRGSVLVISLVIATLSLATLGSYLLLAANEHQAVARAQKWNTCVPVMEAGVEEALTQIHYNGVTGLASNNWTLGTDGYYRKTRYVGTNGSYCKVAILGTNPPVIYSTAYVTAPLSGSQFVVREVRVNTQSISAGKGGLIAKGAISLAGVAVYDSYNSSVAPYSSANPGTNALALSNSGSPGAISLSGNSIIYGTAVTGPGGTVTTAGGGAVGNPAWVAANGGGVEPGWSANDANYQFNDVSAPFSTGLPLTGGTIGGTNYTYVLDGNFNSNFYVSGSMSMNSSQTMIVEGNVTLYVTGSFTTTGQSTVYLAPGSSLNFYVGGSIQMAGGGIVNGTGLPANLHIYGLPTCTTVTITGGAAFMGTVNAPEADILFKGTSDAYGSFIGNTITLGGTAAVHYDQALGANLGYVVASWNEIQP